MKSIQQILIQVHLLCVLLLDLAVSFFVQVLGSGWLVMANDLIVINLTIVYRSRTERCFVLVLAGLVCL